MKCDTDRTVCITLNASLHSLSNSPTTEDADEAKAHDEERAAGFWNGGPGDLRLVVIGAFENPDVVVVLSAEIADPVVRQRDGLGVAAFGEVARAEVVDAGGFVRDFPNGHLEGGGVFWSGVDEAAVAGQQASEVGHLGLCQTNA